MPEGQVMILMLLGVAVGFFLGRIREDRMVRKLNKVMNDSDRVVSYSIAQYNKIIDILKQESSNIILEYVGKRNRTKALDALIASFEEFDEDNFVKNMERRLEVKLAKTSQNVR